MIKKAPWAFKPKGNFFIVRKEKKAEDENQNKHNVTAVKVLHMVRRMGQNHLKHKTHHQKAEEKSQSNNDLHRHHQNYNNMTYI